MKTAKICWVQLHYIRAGIVVSLISHKREFRLGNRVTLSDSQHLTPTPWIYFSDFRAIGKIEKNDDSLETLKHFLFICSHHLAQVFLKFWQQNLSILKSTANLIFIQEEALTQNAHQLVCNWIRSWATLPCAGLLFLWWCPAILMAALLRGPVTIYHDQRDLISFSTPRERESFLSCLLPARVVPGLWRVLREDLLKK